MQNGWTALVWAAHMGHADCVRLLLDAGANKDTMNNVRAIAGCFCLARPMSRRNGDCGITCSFEILRVCVIAFRDEDWFSGCVPYTMIYLLCVFELSII